MSGRVILNGCPNESREIGGASIGEKLPANSILNMLAVSIPELIMLLHESVNLTGKDDC